MTRWQHVALGGGICLLSMAAIVAAFVLGRMMDKDKVVLVATGVAKREITREQLQAGFDEAVSSLKFIAEMKITVNGVETEETVSRAEARWALERIEKAMEAAK